MKWGWRNQGKIISSEKYWETWKRSKKSLMMEEKGMGIPWKQILKTGIESKEIIVRRSWNETVLVFEAAEISRG